MPCDVSPTPAHQRADGRAELTLGAGPEGARIRHLHQAAPLRWLFPDREPDVPREGALVNVAGGLAGGDRLVSTLRVAEGARFTATTPAAEKVYRSLGPESTISTTLEVTGDSAAEWLPQETILFDGARLRRRFAVALAAEARLLAAEMLVFGRAAHGERFARGALSDGWRITRDGRLLWADALRLADPAQALPARFALGGANATATLILAAPDAARHRELARAQAAGGASLVAPGLLVARWLGEAGAVRAGLAAAIVALRAAAFGHAARLPRLWRT